MQNKESKVTISVIEAQTWQLETYTDPLFSTSDYSKCAIIQSQKFKKVKGGLEQRFDKN